MMTIEETLNLVRPNILKMEAYSTARDEYQGPIGVYLDANENPFDNGCNRYPSTALKQKLRTGIAELKQVRPDQLFLGNGSDEAIDLLFRIFCQPGKDNAISIAPTYGMYSVCAEINDIAFRKIQLGKDFSLPVEALLDAADANSRLMFICSPNNPTANAFSSKDLVRLLENFKGLVVVDEAYIDFSSEPSMLQFLGPYPNLVVLQTLSKAYGMAGLRVGLALAEPKLIQLFQEVKYPYNIGTDTLELACKLLENDVQPQIRILLEERRRVSEELKQSKAIQKVWPSDANFLLVKTQKPEALYAYLIARGVIVRDRSRTSGCEGCLRITIGTPEENNLLIKSIRQYEDL